MPRQYRCPFCGELFPPLETESIRGTPFLLEDIEEEEQSVFEEEAEPELQCPFCLFTFTELEWGDDKSEEFLSKKMSPFLTAEKLPGGIRLILNGKSFKINDKMQTDLNLTVCLYSAVFLFIGSLFAIGALMNIYGKTILDVSGGKCILFRGVCGYGRRWCFYVTKKTKFCMEQTRDADESQRENYIVVKEKGKKDFIFGGALTTKKHCYL